MGNRLPPQRCASDPRFAAMAPRNTIVARNAWTAHVRFGEVGSVAVRQFGDSWQECSHRRCLFRQSQSTCWLPRYQMRCPLSSMLQNFVCCLVSSLIHCEPLELNWCHFLYKNVCRCIEKAIFSLARAEAALAKTFFVRGAHEKGRFFSAEASPSKKCDN